MPSHTWDIVARVLMALACGAAIGLEREIKAHPAGVRTHTLVSVGSCIFTALSLYGFPEADQARVAAGVAAGVGFIGAGAILRSEGGIVTGLTTAASLWSCAAVGMVCGVGFYVVALIVTAVILFVLGVIDWKAFLFIDRYRGRSLTVRLWGDFDEVGVRQVLEVLKLQKARTEVLQLMGCDGDYTSELVLAARIPARVSLTGLREELLQVQGVSRIDLL